MRLLWLGVKAFVPLALLTPFLAVGFFYGFARWGFLAGAEAAEDRLNNFPEYLRKQRDDLKGKTA